MNHDKVIRIKDVVNQTGLSSVSIWRKEKEGLFPKRFSLGHHSVGWSLQEISDWVEHRKNNSRIQVGQGEQNA